MTVDVAVVGSPFLDLVFDGLPRVPAAGEEVVGRGFRMVPGGPAMQAIGMTRLGLSVAVVSPRGTDPGGALVARILQAERVRWIGPEAAATPTTAVLSTLEGTAMATVTNDEEPTVGDVSSAEPALVMLSLGRADLRPPGIRACFVSGSIEIDAGVGLPPQPDLDGDTIVLNLNEARALTGEIDPAGAARALARGPRVAVVTLGADGAIAASDDRVYHADAPAVEVIDVTGAGDLFVAAFVWAERRGLDLERALAWSCLYAGLSVREPTALDGALRLDELLAEGRSRGLSPP